MTDFAATWSGYFPDQRPVGFMLRGDGAEHWVRFHSLPESKRYAETEAERRTLLDRQNTLASAVLQEKSRCWLVQCWPKSWEGVDEIDATPRQTGRRGLAFAYEFETDDNHLGFEVWSVHAGCKIWSSGHFDGLLLAIADNVGPHTLWLSIETGAVFAPYDGGVDLFVKDVSQVERLRAAHPDWLSAHPSGL